ncbi:MAG: hypothetical protein HY654_07255 [Acidobacteria bacterium]|nr:hypothetical protein [Acidobacteriota bacterium]
MPSAKSNVHPDHYKTAGRERQGEDIVQEVHRKAFNETRSRHERRKNRLAEKRMPSKAR